MTSQPAQREGPTSWVVMRPLMFVLGVLTIAHPFGGAGVITLFPGWGILGVFQALRRPVVRRVMILAAVWSAAMVVSADVHGDKLVTQLALYGTVTLLATAALWWFHDTVGLRRETVTVMAGVGWFLLNVSHGLEAGFSGNAWKYAIGSPVAVIVLACAWRLRAPRALSVILLVALTAVSLTHDSRFPAGLSVAVAAATLLHKHRVVTRASVVRQLLVFAAAVTLVFVTYPPLADRGYFGHRAREQQATINSQGVNFLFANRPEMMQSAWIAAHHPLLGIGPGSALSSEESSRSIQYLVDLGLPMDINRARYLRGETQDGQVGLGYASHSSGIDSVTHGGLLAAPFWLYYSFLLLRMVLTRAREDVCAVPTLLWLGLLGLWDVLFSPLIGTQWVELSLAVFLATSSPSTTDVAAEGELADPGEASGRGLVRADSSR